MTRTPVAVAFWISSLSIASIQWAGCRSDTLADPLPPIQEAPLLIPEGMDSASAASLTETIESEHFVFHLGLGDSVWVERSEAYHEWAVDYLNVAVSSKISYFKFLTTDDMENAVGRRTNGIAFPPDYALATIHSWNNHECFHVYTGQLCDGPSIRLFEEGMAVAHEFDPFNNDWTAQWNRRELEEPVIYSEKVREYKQEGWLYPIAQILESQDFSAAFPEGGLVLYTEAGMFVRYLIDTFGLDRMKQAYCAVYFTDTSDTILPAFEEIFGAPLADVEAAWHAYLDSTM